MNGERPYPPPSGRDVIGAWLFCLVVAMLALGLTSNRHDGVPPAAEIAGLSPCTSNTGSVCRPAADVQGHLTSTVAGLHRLILPTQRQRDQHPQS